MIVDLSLSFAQVMRGEFAVSNHVLAHARTVLVSKYDSDRDELYEDEDNALKHFLLSDLKCHEVTRMVAT